MNSKALIRISSVVFFYFLCVQVHGQDDNTNPFELSKIIPPSPTAASLGTFGNNAKGSYNGVPDISIPVYHTKVNGQDINISLSYDASGTRAAQDASWVGLGWALSYGGGAITRTVRGMDDLWSGGYYYTQAFPDISYNDDYASLLYANNDPQWNYFQAMKNGAYDPEPDIFTFTFGGYNGRFVFDKQANGSIVHQLDNTNLKITYTNPGWTIVDGNGVSYYFNTRESSQDYSLTTQFEEPDGLNYGDLTDENLTRHDVITAWYVDSIVAPSSQKITFTYTPEESQSVMNKSEHTYNLLQMTGSCDSYDAVDVLPAVQSTYVESRQSLDNRLPDKIIFDNGSIEFHKSVRTDIQMPPGPASGTAYRLSDIVVKDVNGAVIKQFTFYHSYFTVQNEPIGADTRLKLDSLKEFSSSGSSNPPYAFSYFNPDQLPPKYTKAIDHWGYFNNQLNNNTMLPEYVDATTLREFPGANRLADTALSDVQNGVLSTITYPTGGQTKFCYELNTYTNLYGDDQYAVHDSLINLGETYDGEPDKQYTFVLYEPRQVVFNFDYHLPSDPNFTNEFIMDYAFLDLNGQPFITFHNAQPYPNPEITQLTKVLGPGTYTLRLLDVPGYINGVSAEWMNRTVISQRAGGGLRVKKIENIDGAGNKMVKSFLYDQDSMSTGLLLTPVAYNYLISPGNGFYVVNHLYYCIVNGLYISRSSSAINADGFTKSGLIGYSKVTELSGEHGENGKIEYYFHNVSNGYVGFPSIPVTSDPLNGKPTTMKIYDAAGNLLKKTDYSYVQNFTSNIEGIKLMMIPFNPTDFQIQYYSNPSYWTYMSAQTETTYSGSNALANVTNYYYENPVHMQVTRTEQGLSNNDILTTKFKYPTDFASTGAPNQYNAMITQNMLDPVIEQDVYNTNGTNLLKTSKTNYQSWNGTPFLAPVTQQRSTAANVLQTEMTIDNYDSKGNVLEAVGKDGVITSYIWGYHQQYPVAKIIGRTYADAVSSSGINLSIVTSPPDATTLSTELNKLRALTGALVTTYTCTPLIGVTSETDPNGRTASYEYDEFNRLKDIRDQDGNIVKTFDYHYRGR